jgi:adenylylsulfate kinase
MTFVIWITGLPGSGKSAISRELLQLLQAKKEECEYLKLDSFRKNIVKTPRYDKQEREFIYSLLIEDAISHAKKGKNVLIDATGYKKEWRDAIRKGAPNFIEVLIRCPLKVCIKREAQRPSSIIMHGIYRKAIERKKKKKKYPNLGEVVGIDVPYEENAKAEVIIESKKITARQSAAVIMQYLVAKGRLQAK